LGEIFMKEELDKYGVGENALWYYTSRRR
jgi:hypothetical protein